MFTMEVKQQHNNEEGSPSRAVQIYHVPETVSVAKHEGETFTYTYWKEAILLLDMSETKSEEAHVIPY